MGEYRIRSAAVLGAGVMGAKIAAHLANAGIPTCLLDIAPVELTEDERARGLRLEDPAVRSRIVGAGWKSALGARPPALFSQGLARLVRLGNFADDLKSVAEVDWIIEAVTENLEIKRRLFRDLERHRRPGTITSSNTSGIPIARIAAGFSGDFRAHFLGTHFFNPPRYLKLLEIIPTPDTDPELTRFMTRFGADRLGKGVVVCKDTPNFIANRIGVYALARTLLSALQAGLSVEEVDLATGPILGHPRSATFRTFDLIGIDTYVHVARNLYESLPDDPEREVFRVPALLETLAERRWLGDKTGQGFYRRARGKTEFLDPATLEYRPPENPKLAALEMARRVDDLAARTRKLVFGSDRIAAFLWEVVGSTLAYAAAKIPEISDDVTSVDNAIKWGFGHELGPFETWDALGVARAIERLRREKRKVPPLVESLLASGGKSFYRRRGGRTYCFAPSVRSFVREPEPEGVISLRALKERKKVVESNPSASLIDLGDGVACLEFHSKLNTIDADTVELIHAAVDRVAREFVGLVVANEGENFSAGANLVAVLEAARAERWDAIEAAVRRFQDANMRLRYSDKPVVAAPHQRALGGGCEIALHCDQIHAAAELYMGFVEVGVGLVPAGGGCKEMVRAAADACAGSALQLDERTRDAFERIATARVSGSALEAREMGFLRPQDHITLNADRRIHHAKADVLALAREAYAPGAPRQDIVVLGEPGLASLKLTLHMMERAGYITEYDRVVGTRLATVLAGGKFLGVSRVSEQYLLDLEREAFLSLAGEPKTQERMEYMLREGKPLRN